MEIQNFDGAFPVRIDESSFCDTLSLELPSKDSKLTDALLLSAIFESEVFLPSTYIDNGHGSFEPGNILLFPIRTVTEYTFGN